MRARLGILLSGSGSTYANLCDAIDDGRLPAEIAVVVASRPGIGGIERAEARGHAVVVASTPEDVSAALAEHQADWVAMCGWLKFWDPPARWHDRVVNIHPSLLPDFGGKGMYGDRVHAAVIAAGAAHSGCSIHLVSGAYDSGPLLAQQAVPVLPDDDVASLRERVQAAERELYPRVLAAMLEGGLAQRDGQPSLPGFTLVNERA